MLGRRRQHLSWLLGDNGCLSFPAVPVLRDEGELLIDIVPPKMAILKVLITMYLDIICSVNSVCGYSVFFSQSLHDFFPVPAFYF